MRRIDESGALAFDDEDPYAPKRTGDDTASTRRAIDWAAASHALVPTALRRRAIDVEVTTNRDAYTPGEPVHFEVSFRNRLPLPVVLETDSPVCWTWHVDGLTEASHVVAYPDEPGRFSFGRAERKSFHRRWRQRIQTAPTSWEAADPGEYTLSVEVTTPDAAAVGLAAETTFEIE